MTAGTPEHDLRHSGSRWEPATGGLPGALPPPTAAPPTGPSVTQRRPRRGRRALVALAALACLLLGGAGGYFLGHAAGGSGAPTPAGSTGGIPGAGVGGPGDGNGDGDGFRHHDGPGVGPQDGTAPQDGTGSGATPPIGGNV